MLAEDVNACTTEVSLILYSPVPQTTVDAAKCQDSGEHSQRSKRKTHKVNSQQHACDIIQLPVKNQIDVPSPDPPETHSCCTN